MTFRHDIYMDEMKYHTYELNSVEQNRTEHIYITLYKNLYVVANVISYTVLVLQ